MTSTPEQFKTRTLTRVLFGMIFALLLGAALWRFNFQNEQVMQWVQVGLIVLMMALGLWELRRNNRGLERLANVAKAIGRGDYSIRAASGSRDALGLLGQAINAMAERIETSVREIGESRAELLKSKEALDHQNEQLAAAVGRQTRFGEFLADLATIDINTLATRALAHVLTAARAQVGAFYLYDEPTRRLVCLHAQGIDSQTVQCVSQETGFSGLPGAVFAKQKWIFVEDLDEEAVPEIDLGVAKARVRAVYGIPLTFRDQALGVVVLASLNKFEISDVDYVRNHVDALANGLNNALNYKALNRQSVLLEKANADLRKADRLRSEFLANTSHELRTPLNSIIGFSGLLLKNRAGTLDESDLKRAEKINRNGQHLLQLINDILDLSKIEAGRLDVHLAPTHPAPLLREVADLLQLQADARNLQLNVELPPDELIIQTDEQKLRQVLINLAGNAIKFTAQGSVTLQLEPAAAAEGGTIIRVCDTGIGIPADRLESIFEPFRQADSSTTREYGGTGLGLTISRSLTQLLGGKLTVTSEVGKGSTFSVKLPAFPLVEPAAAARNNPTGAAYATAELTADGDAPPRPARLIDEYREVLSRALPVKAGQRVLVVDDDADARGLIGQFVGDLGARAILCADATAAVRMAVGEKPDLITLDLMMPEKSGWEVLSALKAEPAVREIPVVIISVVADRRRALSLGAVDALPKPIVRSEFNAVLERHLRSHGPQQGRVLIVEDDEDARSLMSAWLKAEVAELRTAANGREALELLETFRPDVIFLDLQMPVMDGPTFLQHLRADERFARLPVIVVSARTLEPAERQKLELQVSNILAKGEIFVE